MGASLLYMGDFAEGRAHLNRAFALYDPVEHRPLATRFAFDPGVGILCIRSWALWFLGYPEAALAEQALQNAREIGQATTLMLALAFTSLTLFNCGNYAEVSAQADELVALADEKGTLFWKAHGMMDQGCVLALTVKAWDAVHMITSGFTAWRSTGATAWTPLYLSYLATAYAELDQFDEAWRRIGEAITAAETSKERWCEADIHRMAGEIALLSPNPDAAKAPRGIFCCRRALALMERRALGGGVSIGIVTCSSLDLKEAKAPLDE
jgi:predicted ATPase